MRFLLIFLSFVNLQYAQVNDSSDYQLFQSFGSDFLWGTASAAYQTEGAWNEDGRGLSIWDVFSQKGKIKNGENGNVATDFYHHYKEDIQLAKDMNFDVFRFSISWSRIFPKGTGEINPKGIDFYH